MMFFKKKMIAGMTLGAILMAGGIGSLTVQAAEADNSKCVVEDCFQAVPPEFNRDKAATHIADSMGLKKDEILKAMDKKADFYDIGHAAMLAKISNKSFSKVFGMKKTDNTWKDVGDKLGVTDEQIREFAQDMLYTRLSEKASISKDTAKALVADGYRPMDIEKAGILAKASGKSINDVLAMKKINNRWKDVAGELNVDASLLRQAGPHHGPGPVMGQKPPMIPMTSASK